MPAVSTTVLTDRDRKSLLNQLALQIRAAGERFLQTLLRDPRNAGIVTRQSSNPKFAQLLWEDTLRLVYQALARRMSGKQNGTSERPDTRRPIHSLLSQLKWDSADSTDLFDAIDCVSESNRTGAARQPVLYSLLDAEDLGRIHELLLDVEAGIATEPMSRLRRGRIEVVVPRAQGARYRGTKRRKLLAEDLEASRKAVDSLDDSDEPESLASGVRWIADLPRGEFFLRTGLNRKGAGAYYTPREFVRYLVRRTLGACVAEQSPAGDPCPVAIARLRVLDPAMGTGHFLIESCRFLADALLEACQACVRRAHGKQSKFWRDRVTALGSTGVQLWELLTKNSRLSSSGSLYLRDAKCVCRQLIAENSLYGVDRNPLSVEVARLAITLEVGSPTFSPERLNSHIINGDSLTGPRLIDLRSLPGSEETPLPVELWDGLQRRFGELQNRPKSANFATDRTGRRLKLALQLVATAWSGGVQLSDSRCDDAAWLNLVKDVLRHGRLPERLDQLGCSSDSGSNRKSEFPWDNHPLRAMLARGLGTDDAPAESQACETLLDGPTDCAPAISFEVAFPEVFHSGESTSQSGFDVILGNPPWEAVRPQRTEFFGRYDVAAWAGHTRRERSAVEKRLLRDPAIASNYADYLDRFDGTKHVLDRIYEHQKVFIDGDLAGRYLDQYRVFLERKAQLVNPHGGRVGVVVPASFRANAGAVGMRRLYLLENQLEFLYTFRNSQQAFEAAAGMQFCLLATRFDTTHSRDLRDERTFEMASDLDDAAWLESENRQPAPMAYPIQLLETFGGPHLTIVNFSSAAELELARRLVENTLPLGEHSLFDGIPFQTNPAALNATTDSWRLQATSRICDGDPREPTHAAEIFARGYAPLHEKGTFSRYQAREQSRPRYVVDLKKCDDRPDWLKQLQHFRLVGRSTIHASEPLKTVFALIPPGGLVSNSAFVEATPDQRPLQSALTALAILNSHVFNFLARQQVVLNLNLFILRNLRIPRQIPEPEFLAASALLLSANDASYFKLDVGFGGASAIRQSTLRRAPAIGSGVRLEIEAAINAVVASAYGLTLQDYREILRLGAAHLTPAERLQTLNAFEALLANGSSAFIERVQTAPSSPRRAA